MNKFPSKFQKAEESPGFLLWQVMHKWKRRQQAALKTVGLTHIQFVLTATLGYLAKSGKLITQTHLMKLAKTDKMVTSQVLRSLDEKGFITRKPHPSDGRAHQLNLSSKGEKAVEKAMPLVERVDHEFFAPLEEGVKGLTLSLLCLSKQGD